MLEYIIGIFVSFIALWIGFSYLFSKRDASEYNTQNNVQFIQNINLSIEQQFILKKYHLKSKDSVIIDVNIVKNPSIIVEEYVKLFASISNLIIIANINSEQEKINLFKTLESISPLLVPSWKILQYEGEIGKIAIIRQVRPKILIHEIDLTHGKVEPHVPFIVTIDKNASVSLLDNFK